MPSSSLSNTYLRAMSSPHPSTRRKATKQAPLSTCVNNNKLKNVTPSSSYTVSTEQKIPAKKNTSFRNNKNSEDAFDSSPPMKGGPQKIDKKISNANFGRKLWNDVSKSLENTRTNETIEEESELIGTLTKQLYVAEIRMQRMQVSLTRAEELIKVKEEEVGSLKRKVKDWEVKCKNAEAQRKREQQLYRQQAQNTEEMLNRCQRLEQKILQMEKFLSDYGLVWVGDNGSRLHDSVVNNYIEGCYDQLTENIEQLNVAAGKDEVYVHRDEKGSSASFKTAPSLLLKFYKNGIIVADGSLRLYGDPAAASFLRDILDGYFPAELQEMYPNGVPFQVEDHRLETHMGEYVHFPGHGYRLGKQPSADTCSTTLSTTIHKTRYTTPKSSRCTKQKENYHMGASTSRPLGIKTLLETSPLNLLSLRSQILASHNNVCSDTHLQSHINAELGLCTKRSKRDGATKITDFEIDLNDKKLKVKGITRGRNSFRSGHRSAERLSCKTSPRFDCSQDRLKPRSRSACLPGNRITAFPCPVPKSSFCNKNIGYPSPSSQSVGAEQSGSSRSSIFNCTSSHSRHTAPPILHQVNEPTGKPRELRLKVRSLNGGTVYLVHLCPDDTVAKLYQLLDKAMLKTIRNYKIVSNGYSPRRLDQLAGSLKDSGIITDSVFHLIND